jgi:hypothetical protein
MLVLRAVSTEAAAGVPTPVANGHSAAAEKLEDGVLIALNPRKKEKFRLIEKRVLSHNVRMFRFELQSPKHKLGLPCGKHVYIYGKWAVLPPIHPLTTQEIHCRFASPPPSPVMRTHCRFSGASLIAENALFPGDLVGPEAQPSWYYFYLFLLLLLLLLLLLSLLLLLLLVVVLLLVLLAFILIIIKNNFKFCIVLTICTTLWRQSIRIIHGLKIKNVLEMGNRDIHMAVDQNYLRLRNALEMGNRAIHKPTWLQENFDKRDNL